MKWETSERLLAHSAFTELDRHFARLMERLAGGDAPAVALAAALASERVREGHTRFNVSDATGHPVFCNDGDAPPLAVPDVKEWQVLLHASPVVGRAGELKPLVLDDAGRLYLHRLWEDEQTVARGVRERCGAAVELRDEKLLAESSKKYFPPSPPGETDWQQVAALAALRNRFTVISGGPGTGKTRTVGVLLALWLEQSPAARVALAAPTGKAAARLQESVAGLAETLKFPRALNARLPKEAKTLHRLLGLVPGGGEPKFNEKNPLPFDTVIVDEASMVDLSVMAKLLRALRPDARLVLVGDKDQLASVDAGAVLGDIGAAAGGVVAKAVVQLRKNFRFGATGELAALSMAVNAGEVERVQEIARRAKAAGTGEGAKGRAGEQGESLPGGGTGASDMSAVIFRDAPAPAGLKTALHATVLANFLPMLREADPAKALAALSRFRILCALREGPLGVANLNRLVEDILAEAGVIEPGTRWYAGRPVLVTRNDHSLKLFNGDLGVVLHDDGGDLCACFGAADGGVKIFPPIRLPEHETVFAMTVHKSQGSEFDEVLLILPDAASPVLSRELLYTGLTRARRSVEIWAGAETLAAATRRPLARESGLGERLRAAPETAK
ncbi:MAG: exodeoxyribonuclease V subunit alpha [Verrucomicrobia bacterium]|nr:exodeoxyribonuclease V subunit alpha [Verrucomicrobiota bacterium]